MRHALEVLAAISRRVSWLCALLIGAWVAWSAQPLTVATLLDRTAALEFSYPDLYSELHEQPFAYCDAFSARRQETLSVVRARAKALAASAPLAVLTVVRDYDAEMGAQYEEDCPSGWRPYHNSARFQAVFAQDYPLYYAITVLRLTEIRLALLQMVAGWLGVVAIALLSAYFWRSPLAPIAALIVTSWLMSRGFATMYAIALPGTPLVTVTQQCLFPAVTVVLIIAMIRPVSTRAAAPAGLWITAGLALVYGVHAMVYYVIDPPVARMFVTLGLLYVGLVGVVGRRWQVAAGAVMAAAVQLALDGVFRGPSHEIYAAVSRADHLASEAYRNVMIYMGLFERPTPFGLFYMDEIFGWVVAQDPVLARVAPFLAVHQSYAYTGSTMVWHAILTQPLTVIDAMFRRLLIQIVYPTVWHNWTMTFDRVYAGTLASMVAVNLWAWKRRPLFLAITPITLCLLLNLLAANTVMTMVHTNSRWSLLGVLWMFAVAPVYLFAGVTLLSSIGWTWPNWRMADGLSAIGRRPIRAAGIALGLAASVVTFRMTVTTLEEEREFVRIWMHVHQPPPTGIDIAGVLATLDAMRATTGDRQGELAMWAASILTMYEARNPAIALDQRTTIAERRRAYYRAALTLAPGNQHFLFAARFLQIADWQTYLLEGLRRFPDSVHAPGAAASVKYFGSDLSAADRAMVHGRYEILTSRFLASADGRIPGFEHLPTAAQTLAGSVAARPAGHRGGRPGLRLTMGPGAVALLPRARTLESSSMRLFSYVDLQHGDAESALAVEGERGNLRLIPAGRITATSQLVDGRYQVFEGQAGEKETAFALWLKAGAGGATVEVRDYYPMLDYPKHYYRSGLMDRVRRRAARSGAARSDTPQ
jgi:hypothetical protein